MNKRSIIFVIICIILLIGQAQAISFQEKPNWLCSSLLLSTMASEESLSADQKPVTQAICMIDFDNESLTAAYVPSNGTLIANAADGKPMVFYPQNACYAVSETAYQDQNWRNFGYGSITNSTEGLKFLASDNQVFTNQYPIALLSLSVDSEKAADLNTSFFGKSQAYTRIYLCYGVSDDSKRLETRLIAETGDKEGYMSDIKVLQIFDAEESLGILRFAFSEDKCAVSDAQGTISSIEINNSSTAICPEKSDGAFCWLNNHLIFCVNNNDGRQSGQKNSRLLKMWDPDTGKISSLAELWDGDEINISAAQAPLSMSVNGDSTILAIYFGGSIDEEHPVERGGKIVFVSLNCGEIYEVIPWDEPVGGESNYSYGYCNTDDGKVIYDPSGMIDARLVWYCE